MPSASLQPSDLSPEPDLHPIYPTSAHVASLLSSHSGLTPAQKGKLIAHCVNRACIFGDFPLLSYILSDSQALAFVDLAARDDDGLGLVSLTIQGFGADSDRDVEREECVRLLVAQGADLGPDDAGWTSLHHAALLSPPTLITHLLAHGCSPLAETRRKLTPLDIVTAHSVMPGRADVAFLLEDAMRQEGWQGGRMAQVRKLQDERMKRKENRRIVRNDIGKALGVSPKWWGSESDLSSSESESDEEDNERLYTPPPDYASMLVFSPHLLPGILNSLVTNYQPSLRDGTPANVLYMLARFACLTCDHIWLEDLIISATDAIEETFFDRADDVTCLVFWLYNTTLWLHLLRCDESINEACEMLGSFDLIEEVINSVFVFIIRFAERKVDQLLDSTLLDYTPHGSGVQTVQFESEWAFLRPFTKKKPVPVTPPRSVNRPPSPPVNQSGLPSSASTSTGFSSLRQSFSRARGSTTPLQSMFQDVPSQPTPSQLISFLTALHTLMTLADVNPAMTTQLWSQVVYWTACETFNRILTRRKYLCRSRALQIGMNLSLLEDWVANMGLPLGIQTHLNPVRDLLGWLQCLSSVKDFSDLIATIQRMKSINPLQMRRAVRDYKYEVDEGRMTDECIQYLTQLQKDWERHRVKLGVEALRKEMSEREKEREESVSSLVNEHDGRSMSGPTPSVSSGLSSLSASQQNIDLLFDRSQDSASWEPVRPPQVLGELLDSRYMLPLQFPSDAQLLAALPGKQPLLDEKRDKRSSTELSMRARATSRGQTGGYGVIPWRSRNRRIREVSIGALQRLDGARATARWSRPADSVLDEEKTEDYPPSYSSDDAYPEGEGDSRVHITPLTRKPSGRSRGRQSIGEGNNS